MSRVPRIGARLVALALAASLATLAPSARAAEESAGTRAASFLATPSAPAVLGMGGATFALGRDVQAAASNPAALAWIGGSLASASHVNLDDQTSQEWLATGMRLGRGATRVGVSAIYRDDGSIEGRDVNDQPTGTFGAHDLALTLQLARTFGAHVAAGGAAHWVEQRVGPSAGDGYAFDLGTQVRFGMLSFAIAGRNFGGGMQWSGQRWRMPASLGGGVAFEHSRSGLGVAVDVDAPADYYRSVRLGSEWRRDRFALRGGWSADLGAASLDQTGGPSFGVGVNVGPCWFDYGWVLGGRDVATHRLGLTLQRPAPHASAPAPPREH